ncbi:MAG: arginase [Halobacteriaceae archaeon]
MPRTVEVIGAPADYGANRRGVDMGPSAIRYGGLPDQLASASVDVADRGDLSVTRAEQAGHGPLARPEGDTDRPGDGPSDTDAAVDGRARFLPQVRDVCERLRERVADALAAGRFPLVLGGDHSIAIGTLAGAGADVESLGVLWFDAHGDFNTPATTPSGNVHGMSLAAALGRGTFADRAWARTGALDPANVALVGLRDLDPGERTALQNSDASAYTISDVDDRGLGTVVDEALAVASDGVDALHVSLDLDWLDPSVAPGVGTQVRGGVTYREAHSAMEAVASHHEETGLVASMELVEVNPTLDRHNETAELAAELAASALGKRVL